MKKIITSILLLIFSPLFFATASRFTGVRQVKNIKQIDKHSFIINMSIFLIVMLIFAILLIRLNHKYYKDNKNKNKNKNKSKNDKQSSNIDFKVSKYCKTIPSTKVLKNDSIDKGKSYNTAIYMRIENELNFEKKFKTQYIKCIKLIENMKNIKFAGKKHVYKDICLGETEFENREGFSKLLATISRGNTSFNSILINDKAIISKDNKIFNEIREQLLKNNVDIIWI